VHTPDGAPCGLLNHLSKECFPSTRYFYILKNLRPCFDPEKHNNLETILTNLGMNPISKNINMIHPPDSLHVLLDGRLIGYVE
jgi:DNA-directed RNA polymerase I subunit RPA2